MCTQLFLSICLIRGQTLALSGHLGFLATSRNLLGLLVAVSSSNSVVPQHTPCRSTPLPVPQHCWVKVCRNSSTSSVHFARGSGNGGGRNWLNRKDLAKLQCEKELQLD